MSSELGNETVASWGDDVMTVPHLSNSEALRRAGYTFLYHFTAGENCDSIFKEGLLSRAELSSRSINNVLFVSDEASLRIDEEKNLDDYVKLSLCEEHPMLATVLKKSRLNNPKILKIKLEVADITGVQFSDRNSLANAAKIESTLDHLDLELPQKNYLKDEVWNKPGRELYQAEVLVPKCVPVSYIYVDENDENWTRINSLRYNVSPKKATVRPSQNDTESVAAKRSKQSTADTDEETKRIPVNAAVGNSEMHRLIPAGEIPYSHGVVLDNYYSLADYEQRCAAVPLEPFVTNESPRDYVMRWGKLLYGWSDTKWSEDMTILRGLVFDSLVSRRRLELRLPVLSRGEVVDILRMLDPVIAQWFGLKIPKGLSIKLI